MRVSNPQAPFDKFFDDYEFLTNGTYSSETQRNPMFTLTLVCWYVGAMLGSLIGAVLVSSLKKMWIYVSKLYSFGILPWDNLTIVCHFRFLAAVRIIIVFEWISIFIRRLLRRRRTYFVWCNIRFSSANGTRPCFRNCGKGNA